MTKPKLYTVKLMQRQIKLLIALLNFFGQYFYEQPRTLKELRKSLRSKK